MISENSDAEDESKSSHIPLNDATYDISSNSSSCSHTPIESLSEGYLSDGEVRKGYID